MSHVALVCYIKQGEETLTVLQRIKQSKEGKTKLSEVLFSECDSLLSTCNCVSQNQTIQFVALASGKQFDGK